MFCLLCEQRLQGRIGVLDREGMDHFGSIFIAFQMLGKLDKEDAGETTAVLMFDTEIYLIF
jgi:hypothetical protein